MFAEWCEREQQTMEIQIPQGTLYVTKPIFGQGH